MKAIGLELSKIHRKGLWLTVLLVVGFESLWITIILMTALSRETSVSVTMEYAIAQVSQVQAIFAPVLGTVIVSRLAAIEHDGMMMPVLFAANQSRGSLFLAKYVVAATLSAVAAAVVVLTVSLLLLSRGIPVDPEIMAVWLVGLVLANLAIISAQLVLALIFRRQVVTLTVGIIGGLLGSFAGFVPTAVAALIPWQYPGLVTPVRMNQINGVITGFSSVDHHAVLLILVTMIGVIYIVAGRLIFDRRISK